MKNNLSSILLASVCLFFADMETPQAQVKIGASETSGAVMGTVQKVEEWVQNQVNTASQKMQEFITGPEVQAKIEKLRSLKEDVAAMATEVKDAYSDVSESVSTVTDNVNEIQSGIGEMKDEINSEIDNAKSELDGIRGTSAIMTAELSVQLAEINKQIENRKTAASEELTAKAQAAQDNYAAMQMMYDATEDEADKALLASEMETLNQELGEYQASLEQFKSDGGEAYLSSDSEYQALIAQRKDITQQLAAAAAATAAFAATAISNFLSKSDAEKQQAYNEVIGENFLQKDEPNTTENIARIMKHRQEVYKEDVAHVLYSAIALRLRLDEDLERVEKLQRNMAAVDYKMTAANLLVEQRIEDIKILYNYTNLLIADMRLDTSLNMLNQDHRLKDYDKNPAVLNLDNYVFTKDDIPSDEGKTGFLDSVTAK